VVLITPRQHETATSLCTPAPSRARVTYATRAMGDVPRAGYSVVCIVSPTQLALVRSTGSPSSLVRGFRPRAKSSVQSLVRRGCPDEPRRFVGALIRLAERTHPPHPIPRMVHACTCLWRCQLIPLPGATQLVTPRRWSRPDEPPRPAGPISARHGSELSSAIADQ
jgi:hypothetical protein